MYFEHRTFWLPKDVQDPNAYEDAFEVDDRTGRAAVCDGVASTLFSSRWAAILAKASVAESPNVKDPASVEAWLKRQRELWSADIDETNLSWHQKPKVLEGAGSTLLWIELDPENTIDGVPRPRSLRCYSIGDCCLFHIRSNQVLETFPILDSARFEENPNVIRSVFKRADTVAFEAMETECRPGDFLLLCSDAVAAWTMRQLEAEVPIDWNAYWQLPLEDWQNWVMQLRQDNQIRVDDSTVVMLRVAGAAPMPKISTAQSKSKAKFLDQAEDGVRSALDSLKGSLRKGLKGLSESKWLNDDKSK